MNTKSPTNRPAEITAICAISFFGTVVTVPLIFSDIAKSIGDWYPPFLAFSAVAGFICILGFWFMRKWSVIAYASLLVVNQIIMIVMDVWLLMSLVIPAMVVAVGIYRFKEMK